jgi:hypothetical protein
MHALHRSHLPRTASVVTAAIVAILVTLVLAVAASSVGSNPAASSMPKVAQLPTVSTNAPVTASALAPVLKEPTPLHWGALPVPSPIDVSDSRSRRIPGQD